MGNDNTILNKAKRERNDEFYTQYEDIEKECRYYKEHFKGKVIYCNCDNPHISNFFKFFIDRFDEYDLKSVVAVGYNRTGKGIKGVYDGHALEFSEMVGDGDFRSDESIDILKTSDIVVTNPPFSLFKQYVAQLIANNKQFLILGNINAVSYKETFELLKSNKMWIGISIRSSDRKFTVPDDYGLNAYTCGIDEDGKKFIRVKGVRWYTNLGKPMFNAKLPLTKKYESHEYFSFVKFNAINVNRVADIPYNYDGIMGVPITFIDKWNPLQFEILFVDRGLLTNGKITYQRVFIRKKQ